MPRQLVAKGQGLTPENLVGEDSLQYRFSNVLTISFC